MHVKLMLKPLLILMLVLAVAPVAQAQNAPATGQSFNRAVATVQEQLKDSLAELDQLRQQVVNEKIPLSRRLKALENKLTQSRLEYQQRSRKLDRSALDLNTLRTEIKSRQEETTYLSNLLGDYSRNFESRLHIAELQRYRTALEAARFAPENSNLTAAEVYATQVELVSTSLARLHEALGGTRFKGTAVDADGIVQPGTFMVVGPAVIFRSEDGQHIGTAEPRLGSLEPTIIRFGAEADAAAAAEAITTSTGNDHQHDYLPLDPTLGNAHKIEATKETLWEHVQKGGPVMVPIGVLAGSVLLVALYKWISLLFVRNPSRSRMGELLDAVSRHDSPTAGECAQRVGGPVGKMLRVGVAHIQESRELIEEMMYEEVLTTRLRLQRLLPFIAICAAAAPLLGLLGTVTGIINTFKLITVFGTGDVKTLSGGISEALITTKFGLIVAIPSLLLHAFLSRKARNVIDQMEKAAIAFANQVSKARTGHDYAIIALESDTSLATADGGRAILNNGDADPRAPSWHHGVGTALPIQSKAEAPELRAEAEGYTTKGTRP